MLFNWNFKLHRRDEGGRHDPQSVFSDIIIQQIAINLGICESWTRPNTPYNDKKKCVESDCIYHTVGSFTPIVVRNRINKRELTAVFSFWPFGSHHVHSDRGAMKIENGYLICSMRECYFYFSFIWKIFASVWSPSSSFAESSTHHFSSNAFDHFRCCSISFASLLVLTVKWQNRIPVERRCGQRELLMKRYRCHYVPEMMGTKTYMNIPEKRFVCAVTSGKTK